MARVYVVTHCFFSTHYNDTVISDYVVCFCEITFKIAYM